MKALMSTLLLMVAFTLSLSAQNKPIEVTSNEATVVFESTEFDYGEIETGGDGNCVFTFTNKGKEPVLITNVVATCGCTAPSWTKDPIKPGEKGEIKVKYNTNIIGPFNKQVIVTTNGNPAQTVLRIKGKVNPKQIQVQ